VLAVVVTSGCTVWRMNQAVQLARQSEPFEVAPPSASARLLVVGDSTGVGTGAEERSASVAGLIARDHPGLTVVNRSRDGARIADMAAQLQSVGTQRFDLVLVMGGGNDVIRLTSEDALRAGIARVLAEASARADTVVFMPAGNVGNAPFFFPPWSWLMSQRARQLHAAVRELAAQSGAVYVNLYQDRADDPFAKEPDRLHARDGLHPSEAGYALWYEQLKTQAGLAGRLAKPK
jgi:lysophospholipase L1-like esterase